MDRFARLYALHKILSARRYPISLAALMQELECSSATTKRIIADARNSLGAPIVYDREHNGYQYESGHFEMPGIWFSPNELHALATSLHLLGSLKPGILDRWIEPLQRKLNDIVKDGCREHEEIMRRVRILQMAPRPVTLEHFQKITGALVERTRLRVFYHGRERDELTERTLSPQRLVYYRDNWYLDAWCHLRRGLRSFSLDRLHPVEVLGDESAREIEDAILDEHYATSYGIFAGQPHHIAVLRFSNSRARWVADEQWHPQQQLKVLPDGGCELRVPYSDPREITMDILKYGGDVEVMAPHELREMIERTLRAALDLYRGA
jgi:proteasome accessory factor C